MNQVATRPSLPVTAAEPEMSPHLGHAIDQFALRGGTAFSLLKLEHRTEAMKLQRYYDRAAMQVKPETIMAWLRQLAQAMSKPPSPEEFQSRFASVVRTSGDLAVGAWTELTCAEFARKTKWWPGDAEIDEFLRPISTSLWAKRYAIQQAAAAPMERDRDPPTEAEKRAASESVRQAMAILEKAESRNQRDMLPVKALVQSDERLLVEYTKLAGIPGPMQRAAETRVKLLREKLGQ